MLPSLLTLRRLAIKHHRLAEMDCNGEGIVGGRFYRLDGSTSVAYINRSQGREGISIFEAESDKVEAKIKAIAERLELRVEFQGDPRGYTVKVFKGGTFLDIQG